MCEAIQAKPLINYGDLAEYIKSYPDKVANWFASRLVDDDMKDICMEYYEVACYPDRDGPGFEEWRKQ